MGRDNHWVWTTFGSNKMALHVKQSTRQSICWSKLLVFRRGPVAWLPISYDLPPMDNYYVKRLAYSDTCKSYTIDDLEENSQRIIAKRWPKSDWKLGKSALYIHTHSTQCCCPILTFSLLIGEIWGIVVFSWFKHFKSANYTRT